MKKNTPKLEYRKATLRSITEKEALDGCQLACSLNQPTTFPEAFIRYGTNKAALYAIDSSLKEFQFKQNLPSTFPVIASSSLSPFYAVLAQVSNVPQVDMLTVHHFQNLSAKSVRIEDGPSYGVIVVSFGILVIQSSRLLYYKETSLSNPTKIEIPLPKPIPSAPKHFSCQGGKCFYESENQIHVINVPTESVVFSSPVLSQSASQIVFAAPYLVAIVGNEVLLWDITKNKPVKLDYSGTPRSIAFSNNQRLAIASENLVHVYDITAAFMLFKITDNPGVQIQKVMFFAEDLIVACSTRAITCWSCANLMDQSMPVSGFSSDNELTNFLAHSFQLFFIEKKQTDKFRVYNVKIDKVITSHGTSGTNISKRKSTTPNKEVAFGTFGRKRGANIRPGSEEEDDANKIADGAPSADPTDELEATEGVEGKGKNTWREKKNQKRKSLKRMEPIVAQSDEMVKMSASYRELMAQYSKAQEEIKTLKAEIERLNRKQASFSDAPPETYPDSLASAGKSQSFFSRERRASTPAPQTFWGLGMIDTPPATTMADLKQLKKEKEKSRGSIVQRAFKRRPDASDLFGSKKSDEKDSYRKSTDLTELLSSIRKQQQQPQPAPTPSETPGSPHDDDGLSSSSDLSKPLENSKSRSRRKSRGPPAASLTKSDTGPSLGRVDISAVDQDDKIIDSFSAPGLIGSPKIASRTPVRPEIITSDPSESAERAKRSLEKKRASAPIMDPTRFLNKKPSASQMPNFSEGDDLPETPKTRDEVSSLLSPHRASSNDNIKTIGPSSSGTRRQKSPIKRRSSDVSKHSEILRDSSKTTEAPAEGVPNLSLKPSSSIKNSDSLKSSDPTKAPEAMRSSDSRRRSRGGLDELSSSSSSKVSLTKARKSSDPSPERPRSSDSAKTSSSEGKPFDSIKRSDSSSLTAPGSLKSSAASSAAGSPRKDEFPTFATIYPLSLPFKKKLSNEKLYANFVQHLRAHHQLNHLKFHLKLNSFLSNIHVINAQEKLGEALKIAEGFLGYNDNILQIKSLAPSHCRVLLLLKKFLDPSLEDPVEKKRENAGIIYFVFNKQIIQELAVIWRTFRSKKC